MTCLGTDNGRHQRNVRKMPWARLTAICLGVFCAISLTLAPVIAAAEEDAIAFRWAFGAQVGDGPERKLEAITKDRVLKSGDRLKMMVELQRSCFVYVIYSGPQDQVKLLFPYSLAQITTDYQPTKRYYIPQDGAWLELDQNPGNEVFHVLASSQRLTNLETLLTQYEAAETGQKPTVAKQVLAEVRELKKQNRQLATAAERPISIGGGVRGLDRQPGSDGSDIAAIAQDITASGFFGRTFTIEHQ
jgi:hypothetical protein